MSHRLAFALLAALFALAGVMDYPGALTTSAIAAERTAVVLCLSQEI